MSAWLKRQIFVTTVAQPAPGERIIPQNAGLQVGFDIETSAVCIAVLCYGETSFNLALCC